MSKSTKIQSTRKRGLKTMKPHRLSIIGTGYVGLCTEVGFASRAYKVIASTHSREKATSINRGISPFYERRPRRLNYAEPLYNRSVKGSFEAVVQFHFHNLSRYFSILANSKKLRPLKTLAPPPSV